MTLSRSFSRKIFALTLTMLMMLTGFSSSLASFEKVNALSEVYFHSDVMGDYNRDDPNMITVRGATGLNIRISHSCSDVNDCAEGVVRLNFSTDLIEFDKAKLVQLLPPSRPTNPGDEMPPPPPPVEIDYTVGDGYIEFVSEPEANYSLYLPISDDLNGHIFDMVSSLSISGEQIKQQTYKVIVSDGGSILGNIWFDDNGNGIRDADENINSMGQYGVVITDSDGRYVSFIPMSPDGPFSSTFINGLNNGEYLLEFGEVANMPFGNNSSPVKIIKSYSSKIPVTINNNVIEQDIQINSPLNPETPFKVDVSLDSLNGSYYYYNGPIEDFSDRPLDLILNYSCYDSNSADSPDCGNHTETLTFPSWAIDNVSSVLVIDESNNTHYNKDYVIDGNNLILDLAPNERKIRISLQGDFSNQISETLKVTNRTEWTNYPDNYKESEISIPIIETFSIEGNVFNDFNKNSIFDQNETIQKNYKIYLVDGNKKVITLDHVDGKESNPNSTDLGKYVFMVNQDDMKKQYYLIVGDANEDNIMNPDHTFNYPKTVYSDLTPVTINNNNIDIPILGTEEGTIGGHLYDDTNLNMVKDVGEQIQSDPSCTETSIDNSGRKLTPGDCTETLITKDIATYSGSIYVDSNKDGTKNADESYDSGVVKAYDINHNLVGTAPTTDGVVDGVNKHYWEMKLPSGEYYFKLENNGMVKLFTEIGTKNYSPNEKVTDAKTDLINSIPGDVIDNINFGYFMLDIQDLDVIIHKTVDKTTAKPGDTLTYEISIENPGNYPIAGGSFHDYLPENTKYLGSTWNIEMNPISLSGANQRVFHFMPKEPIKVPAGETIVIGHIKAKITETAELNSTLINGVYGMEYKGDGTCTSDYEWVKLDYRRFAPTTGSELTKLFDPSCAATTIEPQVSHIELNVCLKTADCNTPIAEDKTSWLGEGGSSGVTNTDGQYFWKDLTPNTPGDFTAEIPNWTYLKEVYIDDELITDENGKPYIPTNVESPDPTLTRVITIVVDIKPNSNTPDKPNTPKFESGI